jgi:hypothetical protein
MNSDSTGQRYPNSMPTAGGVLDIVAGSLGLVGTIFLLVFGDIFGSRVLKTSFPSSVWQHWGWPIVIVGIASILFMVIDIPAITGGVFALQRKHWGWALAGAISALIASRILGIIALVFIALTRKEFE